MKVELPFYITERDIMEGVAKWSTNYQPPFSEVQDEFEIRTKKFQEQHRVVVSSQKRDKEDASKECESPLYLNTCRELVNLT
jgi:hypothetical protein